MTKRLRFSNRAVADLKGIWAYTDEHWGRQQAADYLRTLHRHCRAVGQIRSGTKQMEVRGKAYLRSRYKSHYIFALEQADAILIVRILHVAQAPDRHLL